MDVLPLVEFRRCVARYQGAYKVRGFSCLDQFLCLPFAQLTYRESLRDLETCFRAMAPKLFHMGIRGRVARRTLTDANETRRLAQSWPTSPTSSSPAPSRSRLNSTIR
jgi:Domain of unknown function (DUF4372)